MSLERCRFHFLPQTHSCRYALVLGDGDGRFTAKLLAANPGIEVDAIDISQTMLALLRQRSEQASDRLHTHHADARTFPYGSEGKSYDLVVTHFFLDCLTQPELEQLIGCIAPVLAPEAFWLISDFHIPRGPMRLLARAYVRSLYFAFRMLTGLETAQLPDYFTPITEHGFARIASHYSLAGLLGTEVWQRRADNLSPRRSHQIS
ncbi:class I SAM-dependent methyltransferase [Edaphobacter acidisoli]|nr:class I SAM-dependent methyltransferase [Edaphobacter acidisoli]